jgi:hypothetical protein
MYPHLEDVRKVARLLQERRDDTPYLDPRTVRVKGLRYLGNGSYRQVWRYGDYVLKLPRDDEGETHNEREWELYHTTSPENRRYLARPYAFEGIVLITEYVPFRRYRPGRKQIEVADMLACLFALDDLHSYNFGYRAPCGTPIVVDYAS